MAKYEVEIGNNMNDSWLFPGNGTPMRGRWDYQNCSHLDTGERHKSIQQKTSFIPGLCIRIDTDAKKITVFDPLAETSEGRSIWEKIQVAVESFGEGGKFKPWPSQVIDLAVDRDAAGTLKTWMYWCARGISDGMCKPTESSARWPTMEIIEKMDGFRIVYPYDESKTMIEKKGPAAVLAAASA